MAHSWLSYRTPLVVKDEPPARGIAPAPRPSAANELLVPRSPVASGAPTPSTAVGGVSASPSATTKGALATPPAVAMELTVRALFDAHYAAIWRLLRRLGLPESQVDDAAQEVFLIASRRLADIQPGKEHAFLYGVSLRIASNEHRRQRALPETAEVEALSQLSDPSPSPEAHAEERQARELLDLVLDRLPPELRTVFVLCELEGLEVREAAALEGIPLGTAHSRLRRAREEFSAIARRVRAALFARGGRP